MPDDPVAYLITFRCYGTWLHGDPRGSMDPEHRTPGEPMLARDDLRAGFERRRLVHAPAQLDEHQRVVVAAAVVRACEFRDWSLLAVNVRTNHVHAVVAAPVAPEVVMGLMKRRATRALREAGLDGAAERLWSRHGSTRYLWTERSVADACAYVIDGQD